MIAWITAARKKSEDEKVLIDTIVIIISIDSSMDGSLGVLRHIQYVFTAAVCTKAKKVCKWKS